MRNDELFPMIDPPAGGLTQLRTRLDTAQGVRPKRAYAFVLGSGTVLAIAATLLIVIVSRPMSFERLVDESENLALIQYDIKPLPAEKIVILQTRLPRSMEN